MPEERLARSGEKGTQKIRSERKSRLANGRLERPSQQMAVA
jgi:hypothetical protein